MSAELHTFLFCDLVGFTALTDSEGDERAAAVAAALHDHVRVLAIQHDAEVVKAMGDAAMIRTDSAGSGIEMGLSLVDRVESDPALPPIRAGVHRGPAVSRDGDWFGRTVNVASRLCSVAAGGEVLVSESTLADLGESTSISVGERRLHWLKNVTEPVAARVTELNRRAGRLSAVLDRIPRRFGLGLGNHVAAGGMR
jgi:adenylate cyclase